MNSFIGWIGGKKLLRNEITNRFPLNISRYIEVFGGAGWVLFSKERHANIEVYNDYNSDLVNLYKCIKYHCGELQKELSYMLNSRELFEAFKNQYTTPGMTDIQRAARFFMLIKTSYGSDIRSYGCVKKNVLIMIEYLNKIQERLTSVVIENKDFEDLIKLYDKPNSLFYLDPPYYGTEKYYQAQFSQQDHERLFNIIKNMKGNFILSYNDCDYIKNMYRDFTIESINRNHNLTARYSDKTHTFKELIIKNY